ncbi:MAG: glycosyltransferase family 39 protein, partial [Saprospiraceae bacterium]|nr:glycosyltransferase family 39 protein [Pyrinomonadaceae bacterium]
MNLTKIHAFSIKEIVSMYENDKSGGVFSGVHDFRFTILLIILHLSVTLPLAYFLNIWTDEGATLNTTQNGFFHALQNAGTEERQAPLYFWLLSLWREVNGGIFFARIFSIGCSVLAIKFFIDLTRKLLTGKAVFFVSTFFALHPFLIWTSLEIRAYSFLILLSILFLRFYFELSIDEVAPESKKRSFPFLLMIALAGVYTNYYFGFLLVGGFAALLILRRWEAAKNYFVQMLIAGIFVIPLMWSIKSQLEFGTVGFPGESSAAVGIGIIWNHLLTFILPTEIFPSDDISLFSSVRLWLARFSLLFAVALFIKDRGKKIDDVIVGLATIWCVIAAFLLFA